MTREGRAVVILVVEDNPGDMMLIRQLWTQISPSTRLHFVTDGEEALRFLRHEGPYLSAPRPDMVLLDLNLPLKDGREVLKDIKEDPQLNCLPVLILSTSDATDDVQRCYELHANCYFTKPGELEEFTRTIQTIRDCWARLVRLPDYPRLHTSHDQKAS